MRGKTEVVCIMWFLLAITTLAGGGTPGSFRGKIVEGTPSTAATNCIYVQGRNGAARRVDVSHAQLQYAEDVPTSGRSSHPQDALTIGTEVRITAEQGDDGEWHASTIEILSPLPPSSDEHPIQDKAQTL